MQSQRDFFYAVLSQGGLPCIAWRALGEKVFQHRVFDNLETLCTGLADIDYLTAEYYFCISTLEKKSVTVGGKHRVRVQPNMLLSRVLVLDIDFKDGFYSNVASVLTDVNQASDNLGIPKPIAVSSGYGVHVYWPFAAGIPSKEWTSLSKQFKRVVSIFHPHLYADSSRVSDSAGILRIPNSFNLKHDTSKPVEIVQWMTGVVDVGELKEKVVVGADKPTVNLAIEVYDTPPAELSTVAKNCNWLGTYIKTRAEASEPEWYAVLGIASYLQYTTDKGIIGGEKIALQLSQGHADFSAEVALAKYKQAKANQTGPTTCERFRGLRAERCEGCPFATTVKTPIQTGQLAKPATKEEVVNTKVIDEEGNIEVQTVTIPLYPSPYFRGGDGKGGVYVRARVRNDEGEYNDTIEKVYDYDLYPVRRLRTEVLENEFMEIHVWLPKDGLRVLKLPTGLLAEQKKLAVYLAEKGVISEHGKSLRLARYMVDYVRYMQTIGAAEVEFSRFGWRDLRSANPKFVVGNGFIDKDGETQPASFAHFLKPTARMVATAGTLENWKKGFNVYKDMRDCEPYILGSLIGFAAPLMALTPYRGCVYNMVGHGGGGKSTGLQVMASVWGQPLETVVNERDTEIALFNSIGYLNSIPVPMDELTHMTSEALAEFTLAFTTGRGKQRADRSGQNKVNETEWETIVVGTSNTGLYDKIAEFRKGYTAEAMRIYETPIAEPHKEYQEHVSQHMRLLRDNYGHAGRIYMSHIIKQMPIMQKLVDTAITNLTQSAQLKPEERFWGALFACVLVGGSIAAKLGLHNYDVPSLVNHFLKKTGEVRERIKESQSDPVSILSDFLNNNLDAVVKFTVDDKPYLGIDGRGLSMIRSVKIRMELDKNLIPHTAYISSPALTEYCSHKHVDRSWLTDALMAMGVFRKGSFSKRLAAGASISGGSTSIKVYSVDMAHEKLKEVTQDIYEPGVTDETSS